MKDVSKLFRHLAFLFWILEELFDFFIGFKAEIFKKFGRFGYNADCQIFSIMVLIPIPVFAEPSYFVLQIVNCSAVIHAEILFN